MTQITYTNKNIEFSTTTDIETAINELAEAFHLPAKIAYKPRPATLIAEKREKLEMLDHRFISLTCSYCGARLASYTEPRAIEFAKNRTKYCINCGSQFIKFIDETGLICSKTNQDIHSRQGH
jgi:hypothetical protein